MEKGRHLVRFNLGKGKNFMKWKISYPTGVSKYYDSDKVSIIMYNCKLVNQKSAANKIFNGANKTVCAWVQCDRIKVTYNVIYKSSSKQVCYNPRIIPNWIMGDEIVDNIEFKELFTMGKTVRIGDSL